MVKIKRTIASDRTQPASRTKAPRHTGKAKTAGSARPTVKKSSAPVVDLVVPNLASSPFIGSPARRPDAPQSPGSAATRPGETPAAAGPSPLASFDLDVGARAVSEILREQGFAGDPDCKEITFTDFDLTIGQSTKVGDHLIDPRTGERVRHPDPKENGRAVILKLGGNFGDDRNDLKTRYPDIPWDSFVLDKAEWDRADLVEATDPIPSTIKMLQQSDRTPGCREFIVTARRDDKLVPVLADYAKKNDIAIDGVFLTGCKPQTDKLGAPGDAATPLLKPMFMASTIHLLRPDVASVRVVKEKRDDVRPQLVVNFIEDKDKNLRGAWDSLLPLFPNVKFRFYDVVHQGDGKYETKLVAQSGKRPGELVDAYGRSMSRDAAAAYHADEVPLQPAKPRAEVKEVAAASSVGLASYLGKVEQEQWGYYADNVSADTNFLPPDNVTVERGRSTVVDYRTSPTNIGLYMLSTVTAAKLGFVTQQEAIDRLRQTVDTIKQLPKYSTTTVDSAGQSHPVEQLYNWYSIDGTPKEIGNGFISTVDNGNFVAFLMAAKQGLAGADPQLDRDLTQIIERSRFDILYDKGRGLLYHGAEVKDGKLNPTGGCYDMLISEARSAYAVAIMQGDIPPASWTNLKRKLDKEIDGLAVNKELELQSYTGTMFEYLTPRLLMKHEGTPLGAADKQAVELQKSEVAGDIWGKSEAMSDKDYAAYGAKSLSLSKEFQRPGVEVIAPYACQMATELAPDAVADNMRKMEAHGLRGKYGFYESCVVKKSPYGQTEYQVIPKFYAHHIGMGLVGMANQSLNDVVTDWFHGSEYNRDQTLEGLLSTPVSKYRAPASKRTGPATVVSNAYAYESPVSYAKSEIIGNNQFVAHVPAVGGSTWASQNFALSHNEFFYVRDNKTGKMLPIKMGAPDAVRSHAGGKSFDYSLSYPGGKKLLMTVDISIPAEDKVKVSKITINNQTGVDQDLQVTGYLELIMDDINAYLNHPVYRNLYVETETKDGVITSRRRTVQGAEQDKQPLSFFAIRGKDGSVDFAESSRTNFLGRFGSLAAPKAVLDGKSKGTADGSTLDPAMALGKSLKIPAGKKGEVSFVFGMADSKAGLDEVIGREVRGTKRPANKAGVPHYPPDTSHSKMTELFRRTNRELRIKSTPVVATEAKPEELGHWINAGRTYVIDKPLSTKKPWSMVASNGKMGFVATATGWNYSFGVNSQQNRITPYLPDNTTELPLCGVMVKDRTTGESFSITPNPAPSSKGQYQVEMSPGQAKYIFNGNDGLKISMTMSVANQDPVQFWKIDIENGSDKNADLELASFMKWALGANYPATESQTKVEYDPATHAVFARSSDSILPGSVAFHAIAGGGDKVTGNNLFSAADDPFSGLNASVEVKKGGKKQISFILGQATSEVEAKQLVNKYKNIESVNTETVAGVRETNAVLDGLQVSTPDESINTMLNTWLPYQAYYAHFLARSGYYQSGGAYGFRDQLQTAMNLLNTGNPKFKQVAHDHILESAKHQFEKGDVEHWWHPHNNLGQRSTISDNLLWLPYALEHYVDVTGDKAILGEQAPFAVGRDLKPGELDYCQPLPFSDNTATVYEHAKKAIDLVLNERMGEHGIPLMGKGDWNDALDNVGRLGKGESIWLGFFLYGILDKFAGMADKQGDSATATRYRSEAAKLKVNLNKHGWDGEYFARAYTDSGEKITFNDAIVQAWAVLSGGADKDKGSKAIDAAIKSLYKPDANEILLFDKVLDKESWGGALAAYPNGLRENNAQYTHGSSWLPRAVAELGDGDMAVKLYKALLPTVHSTDPRYGAEPYVVAADIYGGARAGEGGWTWYSGGPGWILRTGLEEILGLRFKGENGPKLDIDPCIPKNWPSFKASYKNGTSTYQIEVKNPSGVSTGVEKISVDGVAVDVATGIALLDDGKEHRVEVQMGPNGTRRAGASSTPA